MSLFQWCIVIGLNGAIILFGMWKARDTKRSVDWFLAAKGLPWWMVGLSMFATAVDSGDYVAVAGEAYRQGMSFISAWWMGMTIGWLTVAYIVLVPMYRSGMFTNVEYLEYRFGPVARVISVLIQIQYRTNVLANVTFSLFLTFSIVSYVDQPVKISAQQSAQAVEQTAQTEEQIAQAEAETERRNRQTWFLVVAIALGAAIYTATGGLKSVALTDCLQSVVMVVASLILWWVVYSAVGGWSGFEEKINDAELSHALRHVGSDIEPGSGENVKGERGAPAPLIVFSWIVLMTAYCVVNHSQSMRMLASRSEWDLKMAAVLAAVVTAGMLWFNVTLGILGRAIFPDLASHDLIFPSLVEHFLPTMAPVLLGLVVAGLLAGGISTYDSIGSALAAVFTRDIYARFFVRNAHDHHYLTVSRISTFVVIAVSFVYLPFLEEGMIKLFLKLVNIGVIPLLTVYMFGILTRVHRSSGAIGLAAGIVCGLCRLISEEIVTRYSETHHAWWTNYGDALPAWWTNNAYGMVWAIGITGAAMIVTTLIKGRAGIEETRGLIYQTHEDPSEESTGPKLRTIPGTEGTWLETSQSEVPHMPEYPFPIPAGGLPWFKNPLVWTGLLIGVVSFLNLYVFW